MIILFIGSYISVPCVIDTVDRENDEFRILSSNKEVLRFFSKLYSPEVVIELPKVFTHLRNIRRLTSELVNLRAQRKKYLDLLLPLKPRKVFFFFVAGLPFECWLIDKLSKNSEVYYRPSINRSDIKKIGNLRLHIRALVLKIFYGCSYSPVRLYHSEILGVSDNYLSAVKAKKYRQIDKHNNIAKIFSDRFVEISQGKVLVLLGRYPNIEDLEYRGKLTDILKIVLGDYGPEEILIKQHPRLPITDYSFPDACTLVPDYYPANLLCYKVSVVVSYASAALFEAANMGKRAISLLYLLDSTSQDYVINYRQYLTANTSGNILFPLNMEELAEMLILENKYQ